VENDHAAYCDFTGLLDASYGRSTLGVLRNRVVVRAQGFRMLQGGLPTHECAFGLLLSKGREMIMIELTEEEKGKIAAENLLRANGIDPKGMTEKELAVMVLKLTVLKRMTESEVTGS